MSAPCPGYRPPYGIGTALLLPSGLVGARHAFCPAAAFEATPSGCGMNVFLVLSASPNQQASHAYRFADALLKSLGERHPGMSVNRRDLSANPLPPLSTAYGAALTKRTPFDVPAIRQSEQLIDELERSRHLLIATPMHNFTVPATLKLWIDHEIGRAH